MAHVPRGAAFLSEGGFDTFVSSYRTSGADRRFDRYMERTGQSGGRRAVPGSKNGRRNFPAERDLMKLYVGNLSYNTTEDELRDIFAAYGQPDSVKVITDRDTGRSKGFGFVEFANDQEARAAISGLNGKDVGGRALTVNEARPREEGGGGRGGRGRY
jgi:RNA recognition motif-containing protein